MSDIGPNRPPLFEHDCGTCVFLGTFDHNDLYYCSGANGFRTVIARYDDAGPGYVSGRHLAEQFTLETADTLFERTLRVAYLIAVDAGHIKKGG